ncbi:MAG TPA: dTDP-4-dehydrorhamnose reductase [Nitrospirota bacterium]|nr:dTDP-4-dehydrorhamnose reductase [Nitrospirota bacterium]
MRYLIAGRNGQLARAFIRMFEERAFDFSAPDESHFDITDSASVSDIIDSYKPDVIINCAAYNLVDKAEQDRNRAFAVNATGPELLARAAALRKVFLVHYSSDYVFDGQKENGLYMEDDAVNPLNEYGKSKLAGEGAVRVEAGKYLVFRLSWVFGEGKQNFIHKLMHWAQSNEYLKIACDEFSVPTHTDTVAGVTLKALEQGVTGLYHLTNSGFCSRYEWAQTIFRELGINKFIRPVASTVFNLPAKRPGFSAMSNEKISRLLDIRIPSWEEGVRSYLHERELFHE